MMCIRSSKIAAVPLEIAGKQINGQMDLAPSEDENRRWSDPSLTKIRWKEDAVEPRPRIKFPTILEARDSNSCPPTEKVNILHDGWNTSTHACCMILPSEIHLNMLVICS